MIKVPKQHERGREQTWSHQLKMNGWGTASDEHLVSIWTPIQVEADSKVLELLSGNIQVAGNPKACLLLTVHLASVYIM